jgi:hypothetical protein
MNKLYLIFSLVLLVLVLPYVNAYEFDNVKSFDKYIGNYGKITITNSFGLGSIISELELKDNTDYCGSECSANIQIDMKEDGILIDDIKFLEKQEDEKWIENTIKDYKFYIKDGTKVVFNETINKTEIIDNYLEYKIGTEVKVGTYYVKLEGIKESYQTIDWQITSQGRLINDWAVWLAYTGRYNSLATLVSPVGITTDNSFFWVVDSNAVSEVYKFYMNGTATPTDSHFDTASSGNADPYGLTQDGSFIWITDYYEHAVYKYTMGGFFLSKWTTAPSDNAVGITTNNSYFWITDDVQDEVYKFYMNGTYTGVSFDTSAVGSDSPVGITTDNSYLYIVDGTDTVVYRFYMNGEYCDNNPLDVLNSDPYSIATNNSNFFVIDASDKLIYFYNNLMFSIVTTLNSPAASSTSVTIPITFNCSATITSTGGGVLTNISLWLNTLGSWNLNETKIVTGTNNNSIFIKNITDGVINWTCNSFSNNGQSSWGINRTLIVNVNSPLVIITKPTSMIDYGKISGNFILNWTVSDFNLANCSYFYNGTNKTVVCSNNGTYIPLVKGWNNITIYANDTLGNLGSDYQEFDYKVFQNSIIYNSTTYETQTDNYILNISSDGSQLVTAILYYNGTAYTSTKTGNNVEMLFTNTITHAINDIGNKSFYWNITHGSDVIKVDTNYQNIINTTLNLCNGTNGMTYINFTFKDETTDTYITSTFEIDGTGWEYYLGSNNTIHKTLTFNQQTNQSNFAFCLYRSNQTIHSNSVTFRYDLTGYPEKIYTMSSDLTNATTNVLLYLLSTADGQYSSFQVQDQFSNAISGVSVQAERQVGGVWTVVGLDETGDDGVVTFFFNHLYDHRMTFTHADYDTQVLTIRPTQSLYTVVMPGGITTPDYVPDYLGINYKINPSPGTVLTPGTVYAFNFNITANKSNLDTYSFSLYLSNGTLLNSANGAVAIGSNLTIYLNTSNYEQIIGKYYINVGNGTYQINMRTWTVLQITQGDGSIQTWFDNLSMEDVDIKGKFTGYFIFFLVLFVSIAGLCKITGADLSSPGLPLGLVLGIVWIASLGGFFNITFSPLDFINKFGIALIVTFLSLGYAMGQMRKT